MSADAALAWADALVFSSTGAHLNDLQTTILQQVWDGQRYTDIARRYGCTEGHAKDAGAQLWRLLSRALGEKVTKGNFRAVLERHRVRLTGEDVLAPDSPSPDPVAETPNFMGRSAAIAHLHTLVDRGSSAIVIQGEGGLGKTTLAQQYLQAQGFEVVLELLMAKETAHITPAEWVAAEWLRRDLAGEPGQEFGVTLARLKRHLQTRPVGILVDNLEPALDGQGRFIDPHRAYVELLRVLAETRGPSVTLITSRDRLCEPGVAVEHYRPPGLTPQTWQQFLAIHQIRGQTTTLEQIHRTYGGNAKAMRLLCGTIREDFDGDLTAYWQDHSQDPLLPTTLNNLITSQIERLQRLDPQAYRLLCRLGCYRYQEIPKVPTAGLLALLWDVKPARRRQVIQSLRNRSLVECHQGFYWLHPVIREAAIARLRQSPDWEPACRKAAEFWTHSVTTIATITDARQAWEAYYHYVEVQDFEAASQVILKSRHNQWQQFLPLGSVLYRMGLLQPVLTAIQQIIDHVQSAASLSELHNILGDLYWITGQVHQAMTCQERSMETARQCLAALPPQSDPHQHYYFRMLEIDSLLSMGLYHIDLWELEAAATHLQQVITLGQHTEHYRWAEKASVGLALVYSYSGQPVQARALADGIHQAILRKSPDHTGRFAYFIQRLGQIYANLGEVTTALDLYERAIAFAEASHYMQVKAKSLNGLAELKRQQGHLSAALPHHQAAISLLEEIGAKCDLADAHYQMGLTLYQLGQSQPASERFAQAIQLCQDIGAPRQVERMEAARLSLGC